MNFKPLALSLTAAFAFSCFGCRQEQPGSPPPPKPKTSADTRVPVPLTVPAAPGEQAPGSNTANNVEDAVITGKVRAALLKSEEVKAIEINVETQKGVVQLSGVVPTHSDLEKAVTLANQVEGVRAVQSRLTVRSS